MKLVRCEVNSSHYYDADKYESCPHCRENSLPKAESAGETISLSDLRDSDNAGNETVALQDSENSLSKQIASSSASGNVDEIKTMSYYDFGQEQEPVVGWLTAVNTAAKGISFSLKVGKNNIGRSGSGHAVDVDLNKDATVSRGTQATIIYEPKKRQFLLQPANGSTLVYLNDDLLMNYTQINAYDRITVGETELIFIPLCSDKFSWENMDKGE